MKILVLCASLAVLFYVYVGYPALLRLIVAARGPRPIKRADITPQVSLVVSAYNEGAIIRKKVDNALGLDYPSEALEIVVVSDGSTDGTDDIVLEYEARGVRLIQQPERRGKTAGLNRAVPLLRGAIVIFSDANALYEPDAVRKLVRSFADRNVGCVTGEARYLVNGRAAADLGERIYWDYEMQVKRLETAAGSMVGGDGAIYAIRRDLWRNLPENAINDFLNPLQVVAAGWRAVYDPDAICYEETAGSVRMEYRRRVRIVSRSWRAVFQVPGVLNPFRVGLFAWSVVSHKVLRWFSGAFMALALLAIGGLTLEHPSPWPQQAAALVLLAAMGCLAIPGLRRLMAMLAYFAAVNMASVEGVVRGSLGQVSGVWTTPRDRAEPTSLQLARIGIPVGWLALLACAAMIAAWGASAFLFGPARTAPLVFWTSVLVLGYVYAGYPLLLLAVARRARSPVRSTPIEPSVCLFITANDEAPVIEAKLVNALALDYPTERLQILVASDGSVDQTNAIVRRFESVKLLQFPVRRGKMATINDGIASVTSDIVVFSDANTFLDVGAIRALVGNFADERVGAVSGDVELVGERAWLARSEDLYYWYERRLQRAESEIGSTIGVDGALYAIRRCLFVPPSADTILDDLAIPMAVVRAGYRVVFEPGARAQEQGSETASQEFARKSRVIAGAVQFMMRPDCAVPFGNRQVILSLISHKALRWLSPTFATSAFAASLALAGGPSLYTGVAVAGGFLIGFGLAGCAPQLRRWNVIALAHYFCLVQAAAAVGLIRGLSGRQSVLWRRFMRAPASEPCRVPQ